MKNCQGKSGIVGMSQHIAEYEWANDILENICFEKYYGDVAVCWLSENKNGNKMDTWNFWTIWNFFCLHYF